MNGRLRCRICGSFGSFRVLGRFFVLAVLWLFALGLSLLAWLRLRGGPCRGSGLLSRRGLRGRVGTAQELRKRGPPVALGGWRGGWGDGLRAGRREYGWDHRGAVSGDAGEIALLPDPLKQLRCQLGLVLGEILHDRPAVLLV